MVKRVLLVSKIAPLYRDEFFSELLKSSRLEVVIVAGKRSQNGIRQIDSSISSKFPNRFIWAKAFFFQKERCLWISDTWNRILFGRFDYVILEGGLKQVPTWILGLFAAMTFKKVFLWSHGLRGKETSIHVRLKLFQLMLLRADWMLYGNYQRKLMVQRGFPKRRLHVIGNSVAVPDKFSLELNTDEELCLIFIGRLVAGKKVDCLLRAMANVIYRERPWNLKILGSGDDKDNLMELCASLNIQAHVDFIDEIYNKFDLQQFFNRSDYLISYGNVGLNAIQSLSFGVPVITHDNFCYQNPEVEAVCHGQTGYFFKYDSSKSLVSLIYSLERPSLAMKSRCVEVYQTYYSPSRHAENLITVIESYER